MFYLVEFKDSGIDILDHTQLVCDDDDVSVGDTVTAIYKRNKKLEQHAAKVLHMSDDRKEVERQEELFLLSEDSDDEVLGRGKRKIKRKRYSSSTSNDDAPHPIVPPTKKTKEERKKLQLIATAKSIFKAQKAQTSCQTFSQKPFQISSSNQPPSSQPSSSNQPPSSQPSSSNQSPSSQPSVEKDTVKRQALQIEQLKKENRRLRKERDEARELTKWLTIAKELAAIYEQPTPPLAVMDYKSGEQGSENAVASILAEEEEIADQNEIENFPCQALSSDARDQLRYQDGSANGVVELYPGACIYVLGTAKERCIMHSRSASQVARGLLEAVFKQKALLECSTRGSGRGKRHGDIQRQALCQAAVNAIIVFSRKQAQHAGWRKESAQEITKSLGTKLCELRKMNKHNQI